MANTWENCVLDCLWNTQDVFLVKERLSETKGTIHLSPDFCSILQSIWAESQSEARQVELFRKHSSLWPFSIMIPSRWRISNVSHSLQRCINNLSLVQSNTGYLLYDAHPRWLLAEPCGFPCMGIFADAHILGTSWPDFETLVRGKCVSYSSKKDAQEGMYNAVWGVMRDCKLPLELSLKHAFGQVQVIDGLPLFVSN